MKTVYNSIVTVFIVFFIYGSYGFFIPDCQFIARSPAGLRIYMPDVHGMESFTFKANINAPLESYPDGVISRYSKKKVNGYWLLEDPYIPLQIGFTIHFSTHVVYKGVNYSRKNQRWTCNKLYSQYPPNPPMKVMMLTKPFPIPNIPQVVSTTNLIPSDFSIPDITDYPNLQLTSEDPQTTSALNDRNPFISKITPGSTPQQTTSTSTPSDTTPVVTSFEAAQPSVTTLSTTSPKVSVVTSSSETTKLPVTTASLTTSKPSDITTLVTSQETPLPGTTSESISTQFEFTTGATSESTPQNTDFPTEDPNNLETTSPQVDTTAQTKQTDAPPETTLGATDKSTSSKPNTNPATKSPDISLNSTDSPKDSPSTNSYEEKQNTLMDMLTEGTTVDGSSTATSTTLSARKRETKETTSPLEPTDPSVTKPSKQVTPPPDHDPDAEWTTPKPRTTTTTTDATITRNPNPNPEATTVDPASSFPEHPAYNPIPIWNPSIITKCLIPPGDSSQSEAEKKVDKLECELAATRQSLTELVQEFNKRLTTISKINIDLKNRMDRLETSNRNKPW